MKYLFYLLLSFFVTSCVSMNYKTDFQKIGHEDQSMIKSQGEIPIYYSNAPEGFKYVNSMIEVESGYDHEIIGKVEVFKDGYSPGPGGFIGLGVLTMGVYAFYYVAAVNSVEADKDAVAIMMKDKARENGATAIVYANISTHGMESEFNIGSGYAVKLDENTKSEANQLNLELSNSQIKLFYYGNKQYAPTKSDDIKELFVKPKKNYSKIASLSYSDLAERKEKIEKEIKKAVSEIGGDSFVIKERKNFTQGSICGTTPQGHGIPCTLTYVRYFVDVIKFN